jgi:hypothetical protein
MYLGAITCSRVRSVDKLAKRRACQALHGTFVLIHNLHANVLGVRITVHDHEACIFGQCFKRKYYLNEESSINFSSLTHGVARNPAS